MRIKNQIHITQNRLYKILLLIGLLSPFWTQAQLPVRATPQMIPPYSVKLSDYATANSERLILNLVLGDANEFNRQVILKLYIEGNTGFSARSADMVIGANPITLDGGIPRRLSNIDLRPYFQLENLVGISPAQYSQPMPSGLYQFCFEVYDYLSGQLISDRGCATAYIVLNDPPFLNLPTRGESIAFKEPQNIIFTWTPRHINATNVQYEFTLAEIWDTNIDPQAAFLASRPIYQTTTRSNTLLYGPGETPLLPDKTYAWRVRTLVTDGVSELSLFKNNGYSEIYHFYYTKQCDEPQYILAESSSYSAATVYWQQGDFERYKVQYRKKNGDNTNWYVVNAYNEQAKIQGLEENTTYEYRVGGKCGENGGYVYSRIFEFTTTTRGGQDFTCGVTPVIDIANQEPLPDLGINEVFTAGEFPVTVKRVEGQDGVFSGWGYITVPYLSDTRIRISFDNIKINNDYQLIDGILITDYDPNWSGMDDVGDEIEALLSLGNAIIEALNLDISSTTRDRVNQIVNSIVSQIQQENLPDNLQQEIITAANDLQQASNEYFDAQEAFENAETDEEKEEAKEQMNVAESSVNEAQNNLKEANENAEEYKKRVTDLLKKAIVELYREGKDKEDELVLSYEREFEKIIPEENSSSNIITFELVPIDDQIKNALDSDVESFYENELNLSLYIFSKVLEEEGNEETLNNLMEKSKEVGTDILLEIKDIADKSDREIIDRIKGLLMYAYKGILLNYKL